MSEVQTDFTSQDLYRDPAEGIEKLDQDAKWGVSELDAKGRNCPNPSK